MHKPFLVGKKIYLREIEKDDLTLEYQQWFNDDEVCMYNSHHRFPNYKQDMDEYYNSVIRSHHNLVLGIIDHSTEKHIGNIALENINQIDRNAELAIIIGDKKYWGKGVGKEASALLLGHAFHELNLYRIYCATIDTNIGMQKLAESLGFRKEGIARRAQFKNGEYRDIIYYGLLLDEYEKK